jgi:hypothetical protein
VWRFKRGWIVLPFKRIFSAGVGFGITLVVFVVVFIAALLTRGWSRICTDGALGSAMSNKQSSLIVSWSREFISWFVAIFSISFVNRYPFNQAFSNPAFSFPG